MVHEPSRFLGHSDGPVNLVGRNAVLAVHDQPHGAYYCPVPSKPVDVFAVRSSVFAWNDRELSTILLPKLEIGQKKRPANDYL